MDVYSLQQLQRASDTGLLYLCNQTIDMMETQNMAAITRMPVLLAVMPCQRSPGRHVGMATHLSKPCSTT
jgi:hypothetical protein